jgi:membrane-associated phospholipid phosphatase
VNRSPTADALCLACDRVDPIALTPDDHHLRAAPGQLDRRGPADAARRPGDHDQRHGGDSTSGALIGEARRVQRRSLLVWMAGFAVLAGAAFAALTAIVTSSTRLGIDASAFDIADDIRAPWLNHVARVITAFGLIWIVGPAVVIAAALLLRRGRRPRAATLVGGAALAWAGVWITKAAVDRPRPPAPLVHTSGQSYPSAHAANSVGWLALALALAVMSASRCGRLVAVAAGALLTVLVGLSRIYLRAHYASDVLGGEALAVAMYAVAAIAVLAWRERRLERPMLGRRL